MRRNTRARYRNHTLEEIADLLRPENECVEKKAEELAAIPESTYRTVIPKRFPLPEEAYMPRGCLKCGCSTTFWTRLAGLDRSRSPYVQDLERPARLECISCGQIYPDADFPEDNADSFAGHEYPYYRDPEGRRFYFTACAESARMRILGYRDVFSSLCTAYLRTGKEQFAEKAFMLLSVFADRFEKWPLIDHTAMHMPDKRGMPLRVISEHELGRGHSGWFIHWCAAYMVTEWGVGLDLIKDSAAATTENMNMARDKVIRPVLERNVYPRHWYLVDKFHNSSTNIFRAVAAVASIFPDGLVVRDVIRGTFCLSGGDVVQDLLWGPKGMQYFLENCFDFRGLYAERTTGYQSYAAVGMLTAASCLRGYSDPEGYEPGPDVRGYYRPVRDFKIERDLPLVGRGLCALLELCHSDGKYYALGDIGKPDGTALESVRDLAKRYGHRCILGWERDLVETGRLPRRDNMPEVQSLPYPPTDDIVSQQYGLAIIKSGNSPRQTLSLAWTPHSDYHSHFDSLRVTCRAFGQDLFADIPTAYSSPFHNLWAGRTLAHATLLVDGQGQRPSQGGDLISLEKGRLAAFVDVRDPTVYPHLDEYRRRLALVDCDIPYVVDFFTSCGGKKYEMSWPGPGINLTVPGKNFDRTGGEELDWSSVKIWEKVLGKKALDDGRIVLRERKETVLKADETIRAVWDIKEHRGELFVHGLRGDRLVCAEYPCDIIQNPPEPAALLIHSRDARADVPETFISIYRIAPVNAAEMETSFLAIEDGQGVEVRSGQLADRIYFRGNDAEIGDKETGLVTDGEFVILRFRGGTLEAMEAVGGSYLTVGERSFSPEREAVSIRVEALDFDHAALTVTVENGSFESLEGRRFYFSHKAGAASSIVISRAEPVDNGKYRAFCREQLHFQTGDVSRVEDARALVTLTPLVEEIPAGSVVVVEDRFGCVEESLWSGKPLKIDGTTTNDTPRQILIRLRESCLNSRLANRKFFLSHFAPGDVGGAPALYSWNVREAG